MSPDENPPSQSNDSGFEHESELDSAAERRSPPPSETVHQQTATPDAEAPVAATPRVENSETGPILAEMAHAEAAMATGYTDASAFHTSPPIARNMENLSANGGAIGSLVLGVWCLLGSFITTWSMINGGLGLLMGIWGLTSRKRRMAWLGIFLCLVGIVLSLIQVNELINTYMNRVDETPF